MPNLNLKPSHQVIQIYYQEVRELMAAGQPQKTTVAFANLLRHCAKQVKLRLVEQPTLKRGLRCIAPTGVILDELELRHGVWEVLDRQESLETAIQAKFQQGYPRENILFQSPERVVIYQGGEVPVFNDLIEQSPERLVAGLKRFFEYQKPEVTEWKRVMEEFQGKMAELGKKLITVIDHEYQHNSPFQVAFNHFMKLCQTVINPNLSRAAIEEMLIQHLLTERIFATVFHNPAFVANNVIAKDLNQVVKTLTSPSFNQEEFVKENQLDRFYTTLEKAAVTIDDYADRQPFLNAVYQRFFQGFAVKVADINGVVYTPQVVVEFMVRSVQEILQREFGRSLADEGVHIIDPFVGTGNFIIRLLREIHAQNPSQLAHKYGQELHCNEVMLLPYYIASVNIEHEYHELTGQYLPYEGICLVDTFEMAEETPRNIPITENTQRLQKQTATPIFVIIGNPPYNVGQQNENDNNKNRLYPALNKLVAETYAKDSKATNKNALADVYVKAFQWATWRLRDTEEGIVAFISNNNFLDGIAFDGMRKHLRANFSKIYHINLKGNARTSGERRKQEGGNIFDDAIRVGIGITFLVKQKSRPNPPEVWIYSVADYLTAAHKQEILARAGHLFEVPIQLAQVSPNHLWMTEGLQAEFSSFPPLGTKEGKAVRAEGNGVIFRVYSRGVATSRDAWAYNFNRYALAENMQRTINVYNEQVLRWRNLGDKQANLDDLLPPEEAKVSWSMFLKQHLKRGRLAEFQTGKIRTAMYRPFVLTHLFFDRVMNEALYRQPKMFPNPAAEAENRVICVKGIGVSQPFFTFMVSVIPDVQLTPNGQCFPFYTYADEEEGYQRQENVTDWALNYFHAHYQDHSITKWEIFYYIYGVLHHPSYRDKYAANLKLELPKIPLLKQFRPLSEVGKQLADLHVHYETQPEYPLLRIITPGVALHYRVDRMRFAKEKDSLTYNDALTLTGIPAEAFEYRLGNRSALEWVIDQYQITIDGLRGSRDKLEWLNEYQAKTTKGTGLLNDPNRPDDEQYILRLIGRVITVSLETNKIVKNLRESVEFV